MESESLNDTYLQQSQHMEIVSRWKKLFDIFAGYIGFSCVRISNNDLHDFNTKTRNADYLLGCFIQTYK